MLNRIRQFIAGSPPPTRRITNKRLVPDFDRVLAGFSFWLMSLRKVTGQVSSAHAQLEQKAFLASLEARGLKRTAAGVPLESPFLDNVLEQFRKWKREPEFQCSGKFTFMLNPDASPGWEWFEIRATARAPIDLWKWQCEADRMPTGLDWAHGEFISERCKETIESAGLTGMQFVWVCDVGRYKSPQWFRALPTHPLGRGLDHPFFDKSKILQFYHDKRYPFETWRFGQHSVSGAGLRADARFGMPTADALIPFFPPRDFLVDGFRQMVRRSIPPLDFAYVWSYGMQPIVCCNARARGVLLNNKFLTTDNFIPMWIWDELPSDAEILDDARFPCPPPCPIREPEWSAIQKDLPQKFAEFIASPKPESQITTAIVVDRLRARIEAQQKKSPQTQRAIPPKISHAPKVPQLPKLWDKVLDISDDFWVYTGRESGRSNDSFEVVPRSQLAEFHAENQTAAESMMPGFPPGLIHFAHNGGGDWLSFDVKSLTTDGDCRVLLWSHDPMGIEREWPSIVELLEESLELAEAEESGDDPQ